MKSVTHNLKPSSKLIPRVSTYWYEKIVAYATIFIPVLSIFVLIFIHSQFNVFYLFLFFSFYFLSVIGITLGYHRLFTHRGFIAAKWFEYCLAILGAMAGQGSLFFWVAIHRHHHMSSDTAQDAHSPVCANHKKSRKLYSFLYAHVIWMLKPIDRKYLKYVTDLMKRKDLCWINQRYFIWLGLGIFLPGMVAWFYYPTWQSFLNGILWGGLVRIFVSQHVAWAVNSICHMWGRQPFKTNDNSRNNGCLAILTLGESWHNNHHAFPRSARHGLQRWQVDLSYIVLLVLTYLKITKNIHIPSKLDIIKKLKNKVQDSCSTAN